MNPLLDRIVTTLLRDLAPSHPVGQAVCMAIMVALLFLSAWAIADTIKTSDTDAGLPPPGPRTQAMLGIPILRAFLSMLFRSSNAPQAWTCITLVLICCAITAPAILKVREESRRQQCKANLKTLGLSMWNYHDTFFRLPHDSSSPTNEAFVEPHDPPQEETSLASPL